MKRTSFRTAQNVSPMSVRRIGAGLLIMGLALSASAKDAATAGAAPAKDQTPSAQPTPKVGHKARHWLQVGVASWYGSHFPSQSIERCAPRAHDVDRRIPPAVPRRAHF